MELGASRERRRSDVQCVFLSSSSVSFPRCVVPYMFALPVMAECMRREVSRHFARAYASFDEEPSFAGPDILDIDFGVLSFRIHVVQLDPWSSYNIQIHELYDQRRCLTVHLCIKPASQNVQPLTSGTSVCQLSYACSARTRLLTLICGGGTGTCARTRGGKYVTLEARVFG